MKESSEIHEIRPGCLMLPPLHFPVRVWTADGAQAAAVWNGKNGGLAARLAGSWQEMTGSASSNTRIQFDGGCASPNPAPRATQPPYAAAESESSKARSGPAAVFLLGELEQPRTRASDCGYR
jgi:hypothetical protein